MKMTMRHRQDIHPGILCEERNDDSDDENGNEAQTVHRQDSHSGILCDDDSDNKKMTMRHRQFTNRTVTQRCCAGRLPVTVDFRSS